jgi:exopolysaccharide biosynthesis polyprenyl glycosylphosphotransferase
LASTRKYPSYKYILASLDWLTSNAVFILAARLRGLTMFNDLLWPPTLLIEEVAFLFLSGAITVVVFQYFNLYKINVFVTLVDHFVQITKAILVTVLCLALLAFFTRSSWVIDSRLVFLYFGLFSLAAFLVVRVVVFRKLFLWFSSQRIYQRDVLIIGAGETGKNLAVNIFLHPYAGLHVVGFLDDAVPEGRKVFGEANVIGTIAQLQERVQEHKIEEVIICLEDTEHRHLMDVMDLAMQTKATVKISSPLYEVIPERLFLEQYGKVPVVNVSQTGPSVLKERYKRLFDVVVASAALCLLSPLFLVIAVLIKLDSRGPVLFRQVRIGKNGREFEFLKFRSMHLGSDLDELRVHNATQFIRTKKNERATNGSTKIVNEAMITRVGRWLRKSSLDELPQLINVIRGEMSLVGPRPCLPYEWEHYEDWHKRRLSVLPGCTGVWQVTGRSEVGFEDMVVLDLYYIQNTSLLLDFRVLLKTIPVMMFGTGAK